AKAMDWEWYPHWTMAVYTGMRSGELYALTWDKVNLDDRLIKVDTSWNNKDGFKCTKSGDDRIIEIAPNLLLTLKQLKIQQADSHFVLPRIDKWDKGEQARDLRLFLKGIGLPTIRFHDLRATWATILLSKGVEPIRVMKMGGWKDMKTMMIYVRTAGVDIKGMTDCLDLHNPAANAGQVLKFEGRS
ncbi:MAG: site-specific integrase, partial [Oligoflexia bacterium]